MFILQKKDIFEVAMSAILKEMKQINDVKNLHGTSGELDIVVSGKPLHVRYDACFIHKFQTFRDGWVNEFAKNVKFTVRSNPTNPHLYNDKFFIEYSDIYGGFMNTNNPKYTYKKGICA